MRVEELLQEEFRRAGEAPPPDPEAMLARVERVRRVRAAGAAGSVLVAAAALVVAVVVIPAAVGRGGGGGGEVGGPARGTLYTSQLVNVLFTDRARGYAVQERCVSDPVPEVPSGAPTPDLHQECASHLLVTADGGRNWQERDLPAEPATKDVGFDLMLGHSLMLWRDTPDTVALGSWNREYWTTADGGQTWQKSPTLRPVGQPLSIAWFGPHDELTLLATPLPPDGLQVTGGKLDRHGKHYRGGKYPKNPLAAATDGSFWMACSGRGERAPSGPCVRFTRDEGRTWPAVTPLASATAVDWVATYDGRTVYAAVQAAGGPELVRSTDAGASWAPVTGLTGLPPRGLDGMLLANGDLVMVAAGPEGGLFRLPAGATAAQRIEQVPASANLLYRTGDVLVAAQARQESEEEADLLPMAWISTDDGASWRVVPVPAG